MERFYTTFVNHAEKQSWPIQPDWLCPFGPNYGLEDEIYPYVCSLESSYVIHYQLLPIYALSPLKPIVPPLFCSHRYLSYEEGWAAALAHEFDTKHKIKKSEARGNEEEARRRLQWNDPQRAFFIPSSIKDEAWEVGRMGIGNRPH